MNRKAGEMEAEVVEWDAVTQGRDQPNYITPTFHRNHRLCIKSQWFPAVE
jgi:hypothetical protein